MLVDRTITQFDLEPALRAILTQQDDKTPIPLNAAVRVEVRLQHKTKKNVRITGDCVFVDRAKGIVEYLWLAGDTDVAGDYIVCFVIYFPSDRPQTVPSGSFKEFRIKPQIPVAA